MTAADAAYCVVGLGLHARTKILPALSAAGCRLAGVVTNSSDGAGGAQRFNSLDAALGALPSETVYFLATPPSLHAGQAAQILSAGSDVFVEKPAFVSRQDATRITALSGAKGPVLVEALMYQYTQLFERLLTFWRSKRDSVRGISLRFVIPQIPPNTFRSRMDITSSSLFDIGCYPLSLLQSLGIDMSALQITRLDHAGEPERERLEITATSGGRTIFIEIGVGPAYINEACFQRDGETVTFAPLFYGRPGARTISTEMAAASSAATLEDHNALEAMFAVQRIQWLETQLERNKAMVYQAAQLEILGDELFSRRNNLLFENC